MGVNQWGEDVGWGPTELRPPESELGAEWGAVQLGVLQCWCQGVCCVGRLWEPHCTSGGEMGGHSHSGECQDRSKSDTDWPNSFARVAKHTQHVGSLRELGLEQRAIVEKSAFLQHDGTEGTPVLPSTCAWPLGQWCSPGCSGCCPRCSPAAQQTPSGCGVFSPEVCDCQSMCCGCSGNSALPPASPSLPRLGSSVLPGLKNGERSPYPFQLWVMVEAGLNLIQASLP